ncbi:MAG: hypothetical protein ACOYOI_07575 [Chthoniobacterales bacterium]
MKTILSLAVALVLVSAEKVSASNLFVDDKQVNPYIPVNPYKGDPVVDALNKAAGENLEESQRLLKQDLEIVEKLKLLTEKCKNPALPVGKQLSNEDLEKANQAESQHEKLMCRIQVLDKRLKDISSCLSIYTGSLYEEEGMMQFFKDHASNLTETTEGQLKDYVTKQAEKKNFKQELEMLQAVRSISSPKAKQ